MKIQVARGSVRIRNVIVRSHLDGLVYTATIATPLDRHAIVSQGSGVTPPDGLSQRIELHSQRSARALLMAPQMLEPSVIVLTPESAAEHLAFDEGLFEVEWAPWCVTMFAVNPRAFAEGHVVESWEQREGGADYLEPTL